MAGDWFPIRLTLSDDPAVIAIAAATDLDEFGVVGRLVKLWAWANEHTADGNARGVTESWIDRYTSATGFAAAMLAAGWLAKTPDGVTFPNYDRWNSKSAKKRLMTNLRVQKSRSSTDETLPKRKCNAASVTAALPEKRREEKSKEEPPKPPADAGKGRPRNELFDAVAEVSGLDPATAGPRIGTASAALAKADPPYTPEEVREFGRRFWELCPWAAEKKRTRPTPSELSAHIGLIRSGPANVRAPRLHTPPADAPQTMQDLLAKYGGERKEAS